jgi:Smg protein
MKENVLDVLMYLFENYMDDDAELKTDREALRIELEEAGFPNAEVGKAFAWLEDLADAPQQLDWVRAADSIRVFDVHECARMAVAARGFIIHLQQIGILSAQQREVVIEKIMALDGAEEIDLDQAKWIILMVLFNQPGQEAAYERVEDIVFADCIGAIH